MGQKIHGEDKQDCRRHAGKNSASRKTNPEGRRDENDNETTPRQREPILQMCREWREQDRRKIGIEMQIVAQLRHAERIGVHVRARQTERRFAPVVDGE